MQQVDWRPELVVVSQPAVVVARVQDDWHSVVDRLHQLVGSLYKQTNGLVSIGGGCPVADVEVEYWTLLYVTQCISL